MHNTLFGKLCHSQQISLSLHGLFELGSWHLQRKEFWPLWSKASLKTQDCLISKTVLFTTVWHTAPTMGALFLFKLYFPETCFLPKLYLLGGIIICMSIMVSTTFSTTLNASVHKGCWDSANLSHWASEYAFSCFFSFNTQVFCDVMVSVFHQWGNWGSM